MTTFVLMHGGAMGGWSWRWIAEALRSDGHEVYTPTFTGFGERDHLNGYGVTHDVHVTDIVKTLEYNDIEDCVLVAFSYAGSVAPGVVKQAGNRIRQVIYLDGIVPKVGETIVAAMGWFMQPEEAAALNAQLAGGEGSIGSGADVMLRQAAAQNPFKMDADRQQWMLDHLSDMPMRATVFPISVGAEAIDKPVDYLAVPGDVMVAMHGRARDLGWTVEEVGPECDHAFIIGHPQVAIDFLRRKTAG